MGKENLEEVVRNLEKTRRAVGAIRVSNTAESLRDAWEDFLTSFHRTIGRIISKSLQSKEMRAWGHKLKNASSQDDEGLVYLREARAHTEHGLTPFARFSDPAVILGNGVFHIGGNSSITFSNCSINGLPVGNFRLETREGKLKSVSGEPKLPMYEAGASVALQPIHNPEKRQSFSPPKTIKGIALESADPLKLAETSLCVLEAIYKEYESLLPLPETNRG